MHVTHICLLLPPRGFLKPWYLSLPLYIQNHEHLFNLSALFNLILFVLDRTKPKQFDNHC